MNIFKEILCFFAIFVNPEFFTSDEAEATLGMSHNPQPHICLEAAAITREHILDWRVLGVLLLVLLHPVLDVGLVPDLVSTRQWCQVLPFFLVFVYKYYKFPFINQSVSSLAVLLTALFVSNPRIPHIYKHTTPQAASQNPVLCLIDLAAHIFGTLKLTYLNLSL